MNIKKKEIINKFESFYKDTDSNSIIICEDLGLNASETKNFKVFFWSFGTLISIKNTLFQYFLKKHKFPSCDRLSKNNMVVFCNDPLKTINGIKIFIEKNKIKKIITKGAFIEKKYFDEKETKKLAKYCGLKHLQADTCLTLQAPMILLLRILNLALTTAEKN